jgi:phosphatidylinositol glycan class U
MLGDAMAYLVGVALRHWLATQRVAADRPEVSTPLNSWKRLTEGVHMYNAGMDPYQGVVYHETPLALAVFSNLQAVPHLHWLFNLGDLLTCLVLSRLGRVVAQQRLVAQEAARRTYSKEAQPLLATISATLNAHRSMALAFLLNPYIIANCAGMTSTVWTNLLLAVTLLSLVSGWRALACLALALATYQSLYPALLLVPLLLQRTRGLQGRQAVIKEVVTVFGLFGGALGLLLVSG